MDSLRDSIDRRDFMLKVLSFGGLITLPAFLVSCGTANDPQLDDQYTRNLYAGITDTYNVGSELRRYKEGHFKTIFINGVEFAGGGDGDMKKAVYDTNNDGIIDEAAIPANTGMIWAIVFGG